MPEVIDPGRYSRRIGAALIELKAALAECPEFAHVQVTFDSVHVRDIPPRVHVVMTKPRAPQD